MTKLSPEFNRKHIAAWVWFVVVFLVFATFQWFNTDHLITADDSSEMILSKLLSEENALVSENWYYSTEIRILSMQLIQIPLFKVFKSWHLVRFLTSVIAALIIEASFWCLLKQFRLSKYFPLAGSVLMMPFCEDYYIYVLNTPYYALVIAASFLLVAMTIKFAESQKKLTKVLLLIGIFVLSGLSGTSGPRQLLMTQAPICLAVFIKFLTEIKKGFLKSLKDNVPLIVPAATGLIAFAAGYLSNNFFLSKNYHYFVWSNQLVWEMPSVDKFAEITTSFITSFGFSANGNSVGIVFYSILGFSIFILSLLLIYLGIRNFKKTDINSRYPFLIYVSMLIVYYGLYLLTDMLFMYATRYAVPIAVFIIPLIVSGLSASIKKEKTLTAVLTVLLVLTSVTSGIRYFDYSQTDLVGDRSAIVHYLSDNEIDNFFTTFWDGNIVTELTDGEIEAWIWLDEYNISKLETPDQRYEWLQKASHFTEIPQGKCAVVLKRTEVTACPLGITLSTSCKPSYETYDYVFYVFDSYSDLEELFK